MEQLPNLSFDLGTLEKTGRDNGQDTIKDGDSFYRILPPFGTNNRGALFAFYGVHWGYTTESGGKIPLRCSYDTEKYCPMCEVVFAKEKELKALEASLEMNGDDADGSVEGLVEEAKQFIFEQKADKGYFVNAVNAEGSVVKLKLKPSYVSGTRQEKEGRLVKKLKEAVHDFGVDPVSLEAGITFKFSRTGKGFQTSYDVDFKKTNVKKDGKITTEISVTSLAEEFPELFAQITEQLASGGEGPLYDIHSLFRPRSSVELKAIVEAGAVPSNKDSNGPSLREAKATVAPVATAKAQVAQVTLPKAAARAAPTAKFAIPVAAQVTQAVVEEATEEVSEPAKVEAPAVNTNEGMQAEIARLKNLIKGQAKK